MTPPILTVEEVGYLRMAVLTPAETESLCASHEALRVRNQALEAENATLRGDLEQLAADASECASLQKISEAANALAAYWRGRR